MAPPKSLIWTYFTKTNEATAICKQCFKSVKYCGNTSNSFKHSKTHGIIVDKGKLQKKTDKGTNESSKSTIQLANSKYSMEDDQSQPSTLTSMETDGSGFFLSRSITEAFDRISSNKDKHTHGTYLLNKKIIKKRKRKLL
ncbi:unnamed protein product [Parnassius mnemosyne]|uniref:BED-type domain-containing protein n=1 Tax=Parnassius mnemosyne TaxID=213953 RepID=A0AAV1KZ92_9NEOP